MSHLLAKPGTGPRLHLRVSAGAEASLRAGHPWLFAQSIRSQNRPAELGEVAIIYDRKDRFLALGLCDPLSPLRVRILQQGKPLTIDRAWWLARLRQALDKRRGLFDRLTTGYRCLNGESDGWPGLVLDRYDATFVLKLYSAVWLPRLTEVLSLIGDQLQPESVVLRLSRNLQALASRQFGFDDGQLLFGHLAAHTHWKHHLAIDPSPRLRGRSPLRRAKARPSPLRRGEGEPITEGGVAEALDRIRFLETGLRFEADVVRGQKTGFFLDQRENRRRVEALAQGRNVLNAFSFSGGFSLYAARGGARSVTDLDISQHALASAARNFALNQSEPRIAQCPREAICADSFEWLAERVGGRYDLIVLDPPSLAKRETERAGAIQAYHRLASLGVQRLSPGGILLACSCSAHVSEQEFFDAVRQALDKSGRPFEEMQTTGHAPDHPATFPEAQYLKAIYCRSAAKRQPKR